MPSPLVKEASESKLTRKYKNEKFNCLLDLIQWYFMMVNLCSNHTISLWMTSIPLESSSFWFWLRFCFLALGRDNDTVRRRWGCDSIYCVFGGVSRSEWDLKLTLECCWCWVRVFIDICFCVGNKRIRRSEVIWGDN